MNFCISSLYDEYYKESIGNILFLSSALSHVDGNLTPQCMIIIKVLMDAGLLSCDHFCTIIKITELMDGGSFL